jgi:hypothetical protein
VVGLFRVTRRNDSHRGSLAALATSSFLLVGLCVVAINLGWATPVAAGKALCGPATAETLASSAQLRVYRIEPESAKGVYACGPALRRPVRVGPARSAGHGKGIWFAGLSKLAINGFWVGASELRTEGIDFGSARVRAINVRTRHLALCRLGQWTNGEGMRVTKVLMARRGTLIWTGVNSRKPELGLCTRSSRIVILDEDSGLQIETVKLSGSLLTWVDSTGKHSQLIE